MLDSDDSDLFFFPFVVFVFIMTQDGNSGDPVVVLTRESLGSDGKIVLNKKYGYNTVLE